MPSNDPTPNPAAMTPSPPPRHSFQAAGDSKPTKKNKELGKTKQQGSKPVLWVDLFRCFNCQTEGRSPPLRKCTQCETAYYCSRACQRAHWKIHKPICIAAVAAKAQDATRQRLARAVREEGTDKVESAEDDALCVICFGPPVDPVEVSVGVWLAEGSVARWWYVLCKWGRRGWG